MVKFWETKDDVALPLKKLTQLVTARSIRVLALLVRVGFVASIVIGLTASISCGVVGSVSSAGSILLSLGVGVRILASSRIVGLTGSVGCGVVGSISSPGPVLLSLTGSLGVGVRILVSSRILALLVRVGLIGSVGCAVVGSRRRRCCTTVLLSFALSCCLRICCPIGGPSGRIGDVISVGIGGCVCRS